jgi:hypothetical protein
MLGCFCQTAIERDNEENAMVKVQTADAFTAESARRIIGIIAGEHQVITHGPVFCRSYYPPEEYSIGTLLMPGIGGYPVPTLDDQTRTQIMLSGMPRVRVMAICDLAYERSLLTCFIN